MTSGVSRVDTCATWSAADQSIAGREYCVLLVLQFVARLTRNRGATFCSDKWRPRLCPRDECVERHRHGDQCALGFVHASERDKFPVFRRLDAFCDAIEMHALRKGDTGFYDGGAIGILRSIMDKTLVDLQLGERKVRQTFECGKPGTEVVDGQAVTTQAQALKCFQRARPAQRGDRFGRLQPDIGSGQSQPVQA